MSGDEELMAEVIQVFLTDLPDRLAAINTALTSRDDNGLRAAVHTLRGQRATFRLTDCTEAPQALERLDTGRSEAADVAWRRLSVEATRVIAEMARRSGTAIDAGVDSRRR